MSFVSVLSGSLRYSDLSSSIGAWLQDPVQQRLGQAFHAVFLLSVASVRPMFKESGPSDDMYTHVEREHGKQRSERHDGADGGSTKDTCRMVRSRTPEDQTTYEVLHKISVASTEQTSRAPRHHTAGASVSAIALDRTIHLPLTTAADPQIGSNDIPKWDRGHTVSSSKRALRDITLPWHFTGHANITGLIDVKKILPDSNEIYIFMEPIEADLHHQIITSGQTLTGEHVQYFVDLTALNVKRAQGNRGRMWKPKKSMPVHPVLERKMEARLSGRMRGLPALSGIHDDS
ncbi:hypothetical protein DFH07DRAFT_974616 [Mycena maculata]|uniref:Uncharacterized protein n=1 Tax=Mycena maculata TaxID=230809 RepID=A0AAD7MF28_9AGAR|nr:hypothetical protein DFH07DRAFT_974616 [Mycena maculata]